jgi:hypothetical protein
MIGGIVGGTVGVIGGLVGTYFSITNTQGPTERAFMIRASIIAWVALTLFVALLMLLPHPYRLWLWVPYGILLPLGIIKVNRRVAEIRARENN